MLLGTLSYFSNEEANRLDVDIANQVLYQLPGAPVRVAPGPTPARGLEPAWVSPPRPSAPAGPADLAKPQGFLFRTLPDSGDSPCTFVGADLNFPRA